MPNLTAGFAAPGASTAPTPATLAPGAGQKPAMGQFQNLMNANPQQLGIQAINGVQNNTTGQMMQLQQQLQQNQGQVQQGLINSGLGNSTVAGTMQQAPLQTYNQGAANVQNTGAQNVANLQNQLGQTELQQQQQQQAYLVNLMNAQTAQQANQKPAQGATGGNANGGYFQ